MSSNTRRSDFWTGLPSLVSINVPVIHFKGIIHELKCFTCGNFILLVALDKKSVNHQHQLDLSSDLIRYLQQL